VWTGELATSNTSSCVSLMRLGVSSLVGVAPRVSFAAGNTGAEPLTLSRGRLVFAS
jgi:hypothetical protein